MAQIVIETFINAPAETCFDRMRDIRIHTETTTQTAEKAVAGVTDGMIGLGQSVTFEGRHLGFRQRLTVIVVEFDRPGLFVDEMTEGAFDAFKHIHEFSSTTGGTMMKDTLIWKSPFGVLGRLVDKFLLKRHLRKLVVGRNTLLKKLVEAESS